MTLIPYLGALNVAMTRTGFDLPTIVDPDSGYMSSQFSPDVSIQLIQKLSSFWWDLDFIPEYNYLSMLFDNGTPDSYITTMYRPGLAALKTFVFGGQPLSTARSQLLLDGSESILGTPWFDWADAMVQLVQNSGTGVMHYAVYNMSASGTPAFVVPLSLLTPSNPGVKWPQFPGFVGAFLFAGVCSDGSQIPVLLTNNTVNNHLSVMPFDYLNYPAIAPTWTQTTDNPLITFLDRIYLFANPATKTNTLVWTHNGFSATGTVKVATVTIDAARVATVSPFVAVTVDPGTAFPLQSQLIQVGTYGGLTYDTNFGTPVIGPVIPTSIYYILPDLSGFYEFIFSGAGAPQRPRTVALDNAGNIWTWDFRSGAVWHGPVSGPPPPPTKPDLLIYPPPLPYRLPPVSSCAGVNFRATKMRPMKGH